MQKPLTQSSFSDCLYSMGRRSRIAATTLLAAAFLLTCSPAFATLQDQIDAACTAGGTVTMLPSVTVTTTLNLRCAGSTSPTSLPAVTLQGAPTRITCQTGAAPCITMGTTDASMPPTPNPSFSRYYLGLRDVHLVGPMTTGSEGLRILPTADFANLSNIVIDSFDVGMHFTAGAAGGQNTSIHDLLDGVVVRDTMVGVPAVSTNTAIHLDGPVANVYFTRTQLAGVNRVVLDDGPGDSGANVSFTDAAFNTTLNPGTASVYINTTDASSHLMTLTNMQDWETACPYAELGTHATLVINGMAWNGDPQHSTNQPAFKESGTYDYLRIMNSLVGPCGSGPTYTLVSIASAFDTINIGNSDLYGVANFTGAATGIFTGDRWFGLGAPNTCVTGSTANVRVSANLNTSSCPDR